MKQVLVVALFGGLMMQAAWAGELPEEAGTLVTQYRADEKAIMEEAEQKLVPKWNELMRSLSALQSTYTKAGDLDAAVAIRDYIKELSMTRSLKGMDVRPDPGNLKTLGAMEVGKTYYFRVTGQSSGSLWGTDLYTTDSTLAVAAVHAGVAKVGVETVVKVTIVAGQSAYTGTSRHGVNSSSWGAYDSSFTVEALE